MVKNSIIKNKYLILISAILIFLFLSQISPACPYCNFKLFNELLTTRSGSLASEELLNTIRNQTGQKNASNEDIAALLNPETSLPPLSSEPQGEQKEFIEIINKTSIDVL